MKSAFVIAVLIIFPCLIFSQVTTTPSIPATDDNVTVIFDATKGNAALSGYTGTVYMHTGVITTASTSNADWKYAQGLWGTADVKVEMESLGNHKYRKTYNIRTFYGIPAGTDVLKLVFVFRNTDGTIVGRATDGSDIVVIANAVTMKNYVSHTFTNNILNITTSTGKMTVEPYAANMAKVALYPDGIINRDTTYSVVMSRSATIADLSDNTNYLELNCGELIVHINKNPLQITYISNGKSILKEEMGYFSTSAAQGLRFKLAAGENIYGTGSRATPINKRGQQFYSYNEAHYSYTNGASTMHINIPFIISSAMYGLYIENRSAGTFDLGSTSDSLFQYTVEDGKLSYYVIAGNSFDKILNTYTELTGKQPLPPRWSLGLIQSRFGYKTESETRTTVDAIINDKFPLDGVVLDVYWFGQLADMGNFSWNNSNFPNPTSMINDFKAKGVNTILISQPYITQNSTNYSYCDSHLLFGTDFSGKFTYIVPDFYAGSAGLLDIFKPETKEWLWGKYKARTDEGVSGWWCDVEEPENHPAGMKHVTGTARQVHNVFALNWSAMLYDKYKEVYPSQRLFNLIRSGYAGMQRYSVFPWSGDVNRSFEGFQAQIPMMLGMSMSAVGYMHSDLGGFAQGSYNPELYTRWLQFGAFCPVMRPHGEGVAPEPIYYPEPNKSIVRDYVKLRYQLMPYNYSLAWKNSETGRPLALPLNYFEPSNAAVANVNDEFLWGENLVIAPVMTAGQTSRNVLLPSGKWVNYWTNQLTTGNTSISVSAPLEKMPIFVKAGSFIPMVPPYYTTSKYKTDSLIIKYYPDNSNPNTSFSIYDDDGKTPDANKKGSFDLITLTGTVMTNQTNINLSKTGNGYTGSPAARRMIFQVQRRSIKAFAVYINGKQLKDYTSLTTYSSADTSTYFDQTNQILYIKYLWSGGSDLIVIADDSTYTGISKQSYSKLYLQYPFPNPFTDYTTISYNILEKGSYSLDIYTAQGAVIQSLKYDLNPGSYTYNWYGKDMNNNKLPAGLYFVSLSSSTDKQWMKMVKQ